MPPLPPPIHAQAHLSPSSTAETLHIGPLIIRVLEDGTRTENRVSAVLLSVPGGKSGPPMHWHRFHDELFLVTKGRLTFVTPDGEVTAGVGDLMTVPPKAVHTFRNDGGEECECYMTATPAQYVDYFRMLAKAAEAGKPLTPASVEHLMALFGTFPPDVESEP